MRPMRPPTLFALAASLSTTLLRADHPAAPDGAAIEGSNGGNFGAALTSQQLYVPEDLPGLNVGDVITGISFRLDGASGAFATTTFTRFDIRMGTGNATLGSTFADNFAGPATVVRSGSFALAAGAFPNGSSPNSFGAVIKFDTPFAYAGGPLLIEIRSSLPSPTFTVDTFQDSDGTSGQSAFGSGADATTAGIGIVDHNWAIAFEVTRADASTTERIAIPDGAATEGNSGAAFDFVGGLTGQMRYLPAQLGTLKPGDVINGIGFRLDNPEANFRSTTFSRFDIRLGKGSAGFSTANGTAFADNFAAAPGLVRSGPLTLFQTGIAGNPNPFATRPIHFATPHVYTGGALLFETRTSMQTTRFRVDGSILSGYGGGLFATNDSDATTGDLDAADANFAMELHVVRDRTAPAITFTGKPKLKRGKARVTGTVREAGTVATIQLTSSSGQRGTLAANAAVQPYSFAIRSRKKGKPVTTIVTATDASGNRATARRVYRP